MPAKRIFTKEEINKTKALREKGATLLEIAKEFGYKSNTMIYNACKEHGISTKSTLYYDHDKIDGEIVSLYKEGKSSRDIEKIVGLNQCCVVRTLKRLGIERREPGYFNWDRKYTINENFFEAIDTPEKAYILGLFYTDGCVHQRLNAIYKSNNELHKLENNTISLAFIKTDAYLLESVSMIMGTNKPLTKVKNVAMIVLHSRKLCDDLIKLGCTPKKSLTIQFPTEKQVSRNLLPHFIRGLIDGDGWVSFHKNRNLGLSVGVCSGSRRFITSLYYHLKYLYNIDSQLKLDKTGGSQNKVTIARKEDVKKIYDMCYRDTEFTLRRKKDKFKESFKRNDEYNITNPPATIIRDSITYKRCYVCMEYKTLNFENYGKSNSKYDGFASECKTCKKKIDAEYHKRKMANRL